MMGRRKKDSRTQQFSKPYNITNRILPKEAEVLDTNVDSDAILKETFTVLLSIINYASDDVSDFQTIRTDLISSLNSLKISLHSLNLENILSIENNNNNFLNNNQNDDIDLFRIIEEKVTDARSKLELYSVTLEEESQEVLELHYDIEEALKENINYSSSIRILFRSLLIAYQKQFHYETQQVKILHTQTFDLLYSNTDQVIIHLDEAISFFSRINFLKQFEIEESISIIQSLLVSESKVDAVVTTTPNCPAVQSKKKIDVATLTVKDKVVIDDILPSNDNSDNILQLDILSAVNSFFLLQSNRGRGLSTFLLVGEEGYGKTYILDQIESQYRTSPTIKVIRMNLPLDILGGSVGEAEDIILSIIEVALYSNDKPILVLIDNIEHLFITETNSSHFARRCQSSFCTMIDTMHDTSFTNSNSSILLVASTRQGHIIDNARFDHLFFLDTPGREARQSFLKKMLLFNNPETHIPNEAEAATELMTLLSDVVESSIGRSFAELSQYCRQAAVLASSSNIEFLKALKEQLQMVTPESLRPGTVDDFVDMRIFSSRNLLDSNPSLIESGNYNFPMHGSSASNAWKALTTTIVFPLCRSNELDGILDNESLGEHKIMVGGVLLAGESNTGKTEIAMHSARYAAHLLPSVKLIDVSCTSLIHKEVGGSEKAIRHLFAAVRKATPCILLLDGIENIAAVRGNDQTTEGTLDRVLSTLLVELDGIDEFDNAAERGKMAVIAITNNASWVDPALKRSGRLGKELVMQRDWE